MNTEQRNEATEKLATEFQKIIASGGYFTKDEQFLVLTRSDGLKRFIWTDEDSTNSHQVNETGEVSVTTHYLEGGTREEEYASVESFLAFINECWGDGTETEHGPTSSSTWHANFS